jgi:hypothetical protein
MGKLSLQLLNRWKWLHSLAFGLLHTNIELYDPGANPASLEFTTTTPAM